MLEEGGWHLEAKGHRGSYIVEMNDVDTALCEADADSIGLVDRLSGVQTSMETFHYPTLGQVSVLRASRP